MNSGNKGLKSGLSDWRGLDYIDALLERQSMPASGTRAALTHRGIRDNRYCVFEPRCRGAAKAFVATAGWTAGCFVWLQGSNITNIITLATNNDT